MKKIIISALLSIFGFLIWQVPRLTSSTSILYDNLYFIGIFIGLPIFIAASLFFLKYSIDWFSNKNESQSYLSGAIVFFLTLFILFIIFITFFWSALNSYRQPAGF